MTREKGIALDRLAQDARDQWRSHPNGLTQAQPFDQDRERVLNLATAPPRALFGWIAEGVRDPIGDGGAIGEAGVHESALEGIELDDDGTSDDAMVMDRPGADFPHGVPR